MRKSSLVKLFSALALVVGFLGCASAPMAVPERDQTAKTFAPVADKAVVYIYRHETFGAALTMDVTLNGKPLGKTVSKSFFRVEVAPGACKLVSQGKLDQALDLAVEAGKVYFVWQEVKMGFASGGSKLQVVPEAKGRADVQACKLLEAPASL